MRLKNLPKEVAPADAQFGYKSPMEVPRISKVVLNMGSAKRPRQKILDNAVAT
jgi:large subunit ribosomal protein L5